MKSRRAETLEFFLPPLPSGAVQPYLNAWAESITGMLCTAGKGAWFVRQALWPQETAEASGSKQHWESIERGSLTILP